MSSKKNHKNFLAVNSSKMFIDYKPAELRINSQWLVVYYYKDPFTKSLKRMRVSVPKNKSQRERKKLGQIIVNKINEKLASGWLPIMESQQGNEFKTFLEAQKLFTKQLQTDIERNLKRIDTYRTAKSFFNMINKYIASNQIDVRYTFEVDRSFIINYLDYIFYVRNNSPRTYNNVLNFINQFLNYCLDRGFIKHNPARNIPRKRTNEKKRKVLSEDVKTQVKTLKNTDFHYYVLCMTTYYCFIRRTELTKLLVKNINLNKGFIFLPAEITKNRKNSFVTIPKNFAKLLATHLAKAKQNDYLFSNDNFRAGKEKLSPKKISDKWLNFRKKNNFSNVYQFYSLKDTGITDLLLQGIPALKVRDQARHYDLKITESYTARNTDADTTIINLDFEF